MIITQRRAVQSEFRTKIYFYFSDSYQQILSYQIFLMTSQKNSTHTKFDTILFIRLSWKQRENKTDSLGLDWLPTPLSTLLLIPHSLWKYPVTYPVDGVFGMFGIKQSPSVFRLIITFPWPQKREKVIFVTPFCPSVVVTSTWQQLHKLK